MWKIQNLILKVVFPLEGGGGGKVSPFIPIPEILTSTVMAVLIINTCQVWFCFLIWVIMYDVYIYTISVTGSGTQP